MAAVAAATGRPLALSDERAGARHGAQPPRAAKARVDAATLDRHPAQAGDAAGRRHRAPADRHRTRMRPDPRRRHPRRGAPRAALRARGDVAPRPRRRAGRGPPRGRSRGAGAHVPAVGGVRGGDRRPPGDPRTRTTRDRGHLHPRGGARDRRSGAARTEGGGAASRRVRRCALRDRRTPRGCPRRRAPPRRRRDPRRRRVVHRRRARCASHRDPGGIGVVPRRGHHLRRRGEGGAPRRGSRDHRRARGGLGRVRRRDGDGARAALAADLGTQHHRHRRTGRRQPREARGAGVHRPCGARRRGHGRAPLPRQPRGDPAPVADRGAPPSAHRAAAGPES